MDRDELFADYWLEERARRFAKRAALGVVAGILIGLIINATRG